MYTLANIKTDVSNEVHGTISDANYLSIINRAVKSTLNDVDLRSTKRKSNLSPSVNPGQFDYALPSDVKGQAIVDIRKQVKREEEFTMVEEEEFDRLKSKGGGIFTIADADFSRLLRISSDTTNTDAPINGADGPTSNGTWTAGADASNITLDSSDFVEGGASLNFDTAAGALTAYIENSTMSDVDLTSYELGDIFCWVYIPNTTIPTSFELRWGSSSANYWTRTITTNNEGVAFVTGWNLLRFSMIGGTQTGTVDISAIDYLRFTINKDASDAAITDWRIDFFVARTGWIHQLVYYSKYLWQNTSGTYLQDATATTDYINVDADEYGIILDKCVQYAAQKLDSPKDRDEAKANYQIDIAKYVARYPSERLTQSSTYQHVYTG